MPPIRNPSLSKFHRLVGNKESLAELVLRLFSGHYAKSARILSSPPARPGSKSPIDAAPSLESGPSCLQTQLNQQSLTAEKKFLERKRVLDPPWARPWLSAGTTDVRLLAGFC